MIIPQESVMLSKVRKGEKFRILHIDSDSLSVQMMRFGVTQGSVAECFERVPHGPIILKYGNQQIALGQEYSKLITITKL